MRPLTSETCGMFNLEAFQRMRRHAILVNVTRGPIMDEAALVQALRQGLIGAAGLDVTPVEPLPPGHPLWTMKNVIVTPHASGGSPLRLERMVDMVCNNLKRYLEGQPLLSVMTRRRGTSRARPAPTGLSRQIARRQGGLPRQGGKGWR